MSDDRPAVLAPRLNVVVIVQVTKSGITESFAAHFREGELQNELSVRSSKAKALGMLAKTFPTLFGLVPAAPYLNGPSEDLGSLILSDPARHNVIIEDCTVALSSDTLSPN